MNYLSYYNQYVSSNEKTYVYNVKFSNMVSFKNKTIDEVKNALMKSGDIKLKELGFIRDDEFEAEETKLWYNSLKYSSEELNVMVIMTYNCNCACEYCFENIDKSLLVEDNEIDKTLEYI